MEYRNDENKYNYDKSAQIEDMDMWYIHFTDEELLSERSFHTEEFNNSFLIKKNIGNNSNNYIKYEYHKSKEIYKDGIIGEKKSNIEKE